MKKHSTIRLRHLFLAQLITALTIYLLASFNLHLQSGTLTVTDRNSVVIFWLTTHNGMPSITINWQ